MKKLTFQVLEGIDKGRIYRELPIPTTIGREEGNLLRLNDERISRFHAKIQREDGDIILTDLESTNGTRVNGMPVQIRRLRPGDQIGLGRSTLLFGTMEEIALRKAEQPTARTAHGNISPTLAGTLPAGDDMDFDLASGLATQHPARPGAAPAWGTSESELPPLPQKLTPAQAARLSEIFDYLHRGLTLATENIHANDDGTVVKIGYAEWQTLQAAQMFLARYGRAISDPDHSAD